VESLVLEEDDAVSLLGPLEDSFDIADADDSLEALADADDDEDAEPSLATGAPESDSLSDFFFLASLGFAEGLDEALDGGAGLRGRGGDVVTTVVSPKARLSTMAHSLSAISRNWRVSPSFIWNCSVMPLSCMCVYISHRTPNE